MTRTAQGDDKVATDCWILATDQHRLAAMVGAARGLGGRVTLAVVGCRPLADAAAAVGPDTVAWVEADDSTPAEAYASSLATAVAHAAPRVVAALATPEGRALLAAAAGALGAALVSGMTSMAAEGETVVVERVDLGGRVTELLATNGPLAALFGGGDEETPRGAGAPVERLNIAPAALRIEGTSPVPGAHGGVSTAARVVSVGRGIKAKADLSIVEGLAAALGAEVACSMPIADDFGWVAKERYVGRSGQHIAPRLYLALGISGTPQHLEGVRDAKVVVAVNSDPSAHVFRRADYGIVGDLYEVVPALLTALGK